MKRKDLPLYSKHITMALPMIEKYSPTLAEILSYCDDYITDDIFTTKPMEELNIIIHFFTRKNDTFLFRKIEINGKNLFEIEENELAPLLRKMKIKKLTEKNGIF
jgi:hypothetical protein